VDGEGDGYGDGDEDEDEDEDEGTTGKATEDVDAFSDDDE
jgi:hypothetical protein